MIKDARDDRVGSENHCYLPGNPASWWASQAAGTDFSMRECEVRATSAEREAREGREGKDRLFFPSLPSRISRTALAARTSRSSTPKPIQAPPKAPVVRAKKHPEILKEERLN